MSAGLYILENTFWELSSVLKNVSSSFRLLAKHNMNRKGL